MLLERQRRRVLVLPQRYLRGRLGNRIVSEDTLHQYVLELTNAVRTNDQRVVVRSRNGETLEDLGSPLDQTLEARPGLGRVVDEIDCNEDAHREPDLFRIEQRDAALDSANLLELAETPGDRRRRHAEDLRQVPDGSAGILLDGSQYGAIRFA